MAVEIIFPRVDMDMVSGQVRSWLVAEGEAVSKGEPLFEIETDKAAMEIDAPSSGTLRGITVADGEQTPVGAIIGWIVAPDEAWPRAAEPGASAAATSANGIAGRTPAAERSGPEASVARLPGTRPPGDNPAHSVRATPLARREARRSGVELERVAGSGPNGRIQYEDVRTFIAAPVDEAPAAVPAPAGRGAPAGGAASAPQPARPAPVPITAPHQKIPNSNVRRVIARRLSESKQFVPHFYVSIDVELDRLLGLRGELNGAAPKDGPGHYKLSVNDLLIKASAVTLRRVAKVNASYTDEAIIQYDDVDISVAVSIADGLITPIVRRADVKSLSQISNEARALIARARDGKLKPDEFQGGSFSISNMGMYGVRDFSAIINPPQGAILAISAGERRAVVREGDRIEVATVMTCTLSVDHRVIDGALAAQWMSVFKSVVEAPMSLVV